MMSQNFHLYRVRQRCIDETMKYRRGESYDPSFCFELFYQALHEQDYLAWTLLYEQYRPQVIIWTRRHQAFSSLDEDVEHFTAEAFTRLHKNFRPEKFTDKSTVDSLLTYLRMCVHSAIQDHLRKQRSRLPTTSIDPDDDSDGESAYLEMPDPNPPPNIAVPHDELRKKIHKLLISLLKDEQEKILYYVVFELSLKPKAIYTQYASHFESIEEINRIRERILKRFKENPPLQALLSDFYS